MGNDATKNALQRDTGRHLFGRPAGFVLIVAYKAAWGAVEIIAGLLILFSWRIIARELSEDPNDLFMQWLLLHMPFGPDRALPLGAAVATYGAAKVALAAGLWFRPRLARQVAIIFLSCAAAFGVGAIIWSFSPFKAAALAVDLAILAYVIVVLPRHLRGAGAR